MKAKMSSINENEMEKTKLSSSASHGNIDQSHVETLTSMGFDEEKSKKALIENNGDIDAAMESLMKSDDDDDKRSEQQVEGSGNTTNDSSSSSATNSVPQAKSIKCVETGKLFRTMQDAMIYAERTGHSNFEESDEVVPPMTEEQREEKLKYIRELLAKKKVERQEREKKEEIEREKKRREEGKNMNAIMEEREAIRKRHEAEERQREEKRAQAHKQKVLLEVAKDKAERAANRAEREGRDRKQAYDEAFSKAMGISGKDSEKEEKLPKERMELAIKALSMYKGTGDGLRAMKTLRKMIKNVIESPDDEKFRQINVLNDAFRKKVASLRGGIDFLKACGFRKEQVSESETKLYLAKEEIDIPRLEQAVQLLEAAITSLA